MSYIRLRQWMNERNSFIIVFSHIRPLGAAGALAVDICICFHDIESYIFAKLFPSLAV